ncbi:MAG: Gfo/Idh/MocA family oxidoreductase [Candidatus Poribacteria bacterium]|nr:Gfo/Idh/MocA family oxidoreductase [Candidatus Poribacteria bacterium]
MNGKVRVAMLSFAHVHADGYAKQAKANEHVELVAVWDEEEYGGKQGAERHEIEFTTDLDALLARDDIDAVIVNAITSQHTEVMVKAANAGKHIFTEKALAITVEECDPIIEAVEKAGIKFMISLPSRANADLLLAKKIVEDGVIGNLTFGRGRVAHSGALDKWFSGPSAWFADKKRAGGGGLFDLGCHRMDVVPWLMGKPVKVTALINNLAGAYDIDDNSVTLFEFENKALGVVDVSWVHRSGPNMLELYGTEGSFVLGHGGMHFQSRKLGEDGVKEYLEKRPQAVPAPMIQWVNAIVNDSPMTITIQDGRNLTEVMQAAYISSETGKAVSLPL